MAAPPHTGNGPARRASDDLKPHPEAARVPVMGEEEYEAFRADVQARGILVPLEVTNGDVVLDGRQRLRAALVLELRRYRELRTQARKRQRANLRQAPEVATLPPRGKTRDLAAQWA